MMTATSSRGAGCIGGTGEGSFPASSGPPAHSPFGRGEGGFGFGNGLRAGDQALPSFAVLRGPIRNIAGGDQDFRVFNVAKPSQAHTPNPGNDSGIDPLNAALLAGLALGLAAFLIVKYRPT